MMETNKVNINQLDDIRGGDIEYHPVKNDDRWKVSFIKECIDVKFGRLDVDGFSADELEEIDVFSSSLFPRFPWGSHCFTKKTLSCPYTFM